MYFREHPGVIIHESAGEIRFWIVLRSGEQGRKEQHVVEEEGKIASKEDSGKECDGHSGCFLLSLITADRDGGSQDQATGIIPVISPTVIVSTFRTVESVMGQV